MPAMTRRASLGVFAAGLAAPALAQAPAFPNRPIRMVVPFVPGSNADVNARLLTNQMSKQMGQGFVIENRGGASGIIGIEAAAKAAALADLEAAHGAAAASASRLFWPPESEPASLLVMVESLKRTSSSFIRSPISRPGTFIMRAMNCMFWRMVRSPYMENFCVM